MNTRPQIPLQGWNLHATECITFRFYLVEREADANTIYWTRRTFGRLDCIQWRREKENSVLNPATHGEGAHFGKSLSLDTLFPENLHFSDNLWCFFKWYKWYEKWMDEIENRRSNSWAKTLVGSIENSALNFEYSSNAYKTPQTSHIFSPLSLFLFETVFVSMKI